MLESEKRVIEKTEEIDRLNLTIEELKKRTEREDDWRLQVEQQLLEIQAIKEDAIKERLETVVKVSQHS